MYDPTTNYDGWKLDYPAHWDAPAQPPESALTERMERNGYDWNSGDECWSRVLRSVIRTARRAHHGIAIGQRYRETTTLSVDTRGNSYRVRTYKLIKGA